MVYSRESPPPSLFRGEGRESMSWWVWVEGSKIVIIQKSLQIFVPFFPFFSLFSLSFSHTDSRVKMSTRFLCIITFENFRPEIIPLYDSPKRDVQRFEQRSYSIERQLGTKIWCFEITSRSRMGSIRWSQGDNREYVSSLLSLSLPLEISWKKELAEEVYFWLVFSGIRGNET